MRIVVFGAAGNVGRRVVAEALSRGYAVTAVVRTSTAAPSLPSAGIETVVGNAASAEDVARLSAGHDVAIAATRPAPGNEPAHVAMARALLVGGAGSLRLPDTGGRAVDDRRYVSPTWRDIALACCEQLKACQAETHADWTYLSPPALLHPGERTGTYRIGTDELILDTNGNSAISIEDLAVALLDEAERPRHRGARCTVAY